MIEYLRINDSILNRIDSKHNISNRDTRLCFDTKICIDKRNRFLNYFIYKKIKWIYPDFWVNGDTISYEKLKSEILRSKADKSKLIYESIDIDPSKENCEYFVTFVQLTENVMKMTVKPFEECVLCDKWITIILRFSDDEIVDVEVLEFMS